MVITRYLLKEITLTFVVVVTVLMLVFLSNQFVRYLSAAASGNIAGSVLFQVILCEIPHLLGLLLPLGFYLAILLAYGRLYSDSEMLVLHACGFSRSQLCKLTYGVAGGALILVLLLNFYLTPLALHRRDQQLANTGMASLLSTILPGRFQQGGDGKSVFFVQSLSRDRQSMQKVFVAQRQPAKQDKAAQWTILAADKGYQHIDEETGDRFIITEDGHRYLGTPGKQDYQVVDFKRYGMRVGNARLAMQHADADTLSTPKLWARMRAGNARAMAEWQWRWSMPISIVWLTLLAVALCRIQPRKGRYSRLLPAILLYTCYANLMFVSRAWVQKATIAPWIGMWWVQVLFLAISIFAWYAQDEHKGLRRWLRLA